MVKNDGDTDLKVQNLVPTQGVTIKLTVSASKKFYVHLQLTFILLLQHCLLAVQVWCIM